MIYLCIGLIHEIDNSFADPIHDAAEKGNLKEINREPEIGANVNAQGKSYMTPLFIAVKGDHQKVAIQLCYESSVFVKLQITRCIRLWVMLHPATQTDS